MEVTMSEACPRVDTNGEKKKSKKKRKRSAAVSNGNGHFDESKDAKIADEPSKYETNGTATKKEKKHKPKKKKQKKQHSANGETNGEKERNGSSTAELNQAAKSTKANGAISVTPYDENNFPPFVSFTQADGVFPNKAMALIKSKFEKPTAIQSQCWPVLSAKRDIVGIAETGSGKTLAFLMPALSHIEQRRPSLPKGTKGPFALILSPTRELAMQTAEVCEEVGGAIGVRSVCIYGGVDKGPQRKALNSGVQIVVATPGRLLDLVNDGCLVLDQVTYLILDEADRMLDLGFEQDIRKIIARVSKKRQTLMFSATWPPTIQQLASEFLSAPVRVTIGSEELTACRAVTQIVEVIDHYARDQRLLELLRKYHGSRKNRVLIFVLYKKEAPRIEQFLLKNGWPAMAIHGDKGQADRSRALEEFKLGNQPLLIATDVAARGLDIPDVEYVINYSFPLTIEDYIHRIGRTGRAGKQGVAHTMFTSFDKTKAGELVNVLREANQTVPEELLKFGTHVKKKEHHLYGHHFKAQDDGAPQQERKHIKFD